MKNIRPLITPLILLFSLGMTFSALGTKTYCSVDTGLAGSDVWSRAGTNNPAHIYGPANRVYTTYINGVGNNGESPIIASGEAFWSKSNTSGATFSYDERVKSRTQGTFKVGSSQNTFQINLIADGINDQVTLVQNPHASTNFDELYDGVKLIATDGTPAIFSKSDDGYELAINALPNALQAINIPVFISGSSASDMVISWDASAQFYASSCLSLIDQMTGESYSIEMEGELTFNHDPEFDGSRFVIRVGQTAIPAIEEVTCHGLADGKITIAPQAMTDVLVIDPEGEVILITTLDYSEVTLENLNSGLYNVNMSVHDDCSDLSFDIYIDQPEPVIADFNSAISTYALIDGQAHVDFQNLSHGATEYVWHFGDNSLVSMSENPSHTFDAAGEFTVTLDANNEECESSISKEIIIIENHSTSVAELYEQGQISAWMTQDEIHVGFNLDTPTAYRICVYNVLGQKLIPPVRQEFESQRVILPCNASSALIEIYDIKRNERHTIQVIH